MSIDFESKIKIKEKDFDDIKQKYENYLLSQNTKISQQQEQIKKFLSIIDELKSDFALKLKDKEDESKHLMQEKDKKVVELNQIETDHKKLLSTVDELNKQIDDIQPEEYQKTFKYIESKKSPILIFGAAGTGKSFFIKSLKSRYPNKNIVILAPTGIAALNIKGQTIHSFFKFPQHPFPSNNDQKRFLVYRNIDILIIDEISMVRCDLLDSINDILKAARNSTEAFGKVQTILMGDPFQLPPVVKRNNSGLIKTLSKFYPDNGFYFFDSLILKNTPIYYVIFNRIFRQNDPLFISCLNRVRVDRNIKSSLEYINKNVNKNKIDIENITTITPYRQTAKNINESRLASINEPEYKYPAKLEGSFCTRNPKDFPAEKDLILKKGAIVMFTQNDQDKRYVNGSLGKVVKLSNDKIYVHVLDSEHIVDVEQTSWEEYETKYNEETKKIEHTVSGSFIQYSLILGWAFTIHKIQGKTISKIFIDFKNRPFAHGMLYVALTRARNVSDIVLSRDINESDNIVDSSVFKYYDFVKRKIEESQVSFQLSAIIDKDTSSQE